jgi:hypothetical protein
MTKFLIEGFNIAGGVIPKLLSSIMYNAFESRPPHYINRLIIYVFILPFAKVSLIVVHPIANMIFKKNLPRLRNIFVLFLISAGVINLAKKSVLHDGITGAQAKQQVVLGDV